jgi:hypothetical protein
MDVAEQAGRNLAHIGSKEIELTERGDDRKKRVKIERTAWIIEGEGIKLRVDN